MGLNIFVSNKCFIYCKGCYSYSREEKCNDVLQTPILERFLQYAYNYGIKKVTFCGGDPLAREDILDLLRRTKNIGFLISIDTIGTSLLRNVKVGKTTIEKIDVQELSKYVDCVGIPIDGSSNEIFKLFRPTTRNILKEQKEICNVLNNHKVKICINTVVHKGNITDAKELSKLMKNIGAYKWQVFQFAPLGKYGFKNRKYFEISEKEFDMFKNAVLKELSTTPLKVEFKKNKNRVKHYMLIDNFGNAWMPEFERIKTKEKNNFEHDRYIIGNIKNKEDWEKICKYVKDYLI